VDLPLGKDGGVRNAEVSTLSAIPLSQFRYAHCQLPLGRGAFRPCVKHLDKLQFEMFLITKSNLILSHTIFILNILSTPFI
ncbi:MAG: hypothetical protein IJB70_10820, partial [Clostridia bacterium]|nr:hypothetical protein [Clostridia bacterium]